MDQAKEIATIIANKHGEDKPCRVCLRIAQEILDAGYTKLPDVEMPVLTDEVAEGRMLRWKN